MSSESSLASLSNGQTRQTIPQWVIVGIMVSSLLIIGLWSALTPDSAHGKAEAVGYAICHRIGERSFSALGYQLPLCARCTGIYLGVMTGLSLYIASGRGKATNLPSWKISGALGLSVVVLGVDGLNSYFHLFPGFNYGIYEPNNTLRLITGIYCGITLITLVLPIFNNVMWRKDDNRRVLENWRELGGLLLVTTLVLAATLTRRPMILLVFGYASAIGVVLVLTLINAVMVTTVLRLDRSFNSLREMWLPLLGGLALAMLMIGGIDLLRYSLTGTWEGFEFPPTAIINWINWR